MNEPTAQAEPVGLFEHASIQNGGGLLDRIASEPPQAEPDLIEHRASARMDQESGAAEKLEATTDADGRTVLHVDQKDYAHVKDHKGRPFDPTKHKVTPDGKPDFNARGRVKMLGTGEKNPVKLAFRKIGINLPDPDSDDGRTPEEREAQASVILTDELIRVNAECIADLYCGTGVIAVGNRFGKGWDKGRRSKLVTAMMHYDRQTNGGLMKVTPWVVLAHAFAADCAMVAGGDLFDKGGGLFGWWKRWRDGRKRQVIQPRAEAKEEDHAAA